MSDQPSSGRAVPFDPAHGTTATPLGDNFNPRVDHGPDVSGLYPPKVHQPDHNIEWQRQLKLKLIDLQMKTIDLPFLENPSNKQNDKLAYDNYCCALFNILSWMHECTPLHQIEPMIIEYVNTHHKWLNDNDKANRHAYGFNFYFLIDRIMNKDKDVTETVTPKDNEDAKPQVVEEKPVEVKPPKADKKVQPKDEPKPKGKGKKGQQQDVIDETTDTVHDEIGHQPDSHPSPTDGGSVQSDEREPETASQDPANPS